MRIFLFCLLVLGLDVAFALASAGKVVIHAFNQFWSCIPISILSGVAGIVLFVVLTLGVSLVAFPKREKAR